MHAASQKISKESVKESIYKLEHKVEFLSKKMKTAPLKEMYFNTMRLDHQVATLSNKLRYYPLNTKPRTLMEHVAHMGV